MFHQARNTLVSHIIYNFILFSLPSYDISQYKQYFAAYFTTYVCGLNRHYATGTNSMHSRALYREFERDMHLIFTKEQLTFIAQIRFSRIMVYYRHLLFHVDRIDVRFWMHSIAYKYRQKAQNTILSFTYWVKFMIVHFSALSTLWKINFLCS